MVTKVLPDKKSVNINKRYALLKLTNILEEFLEKSLWESYKSVVILCIGTDRSTGDCLGPLVGYKLSVLRYNNVYVHGTLENPVHAKNLTDTLNFINKNYEKPFIIAIDACLGTSEHIGHITIGEGCLRPGAGVNKTLPPVGHVHIVGVVNLGGFMEYLILQNTRLNLVMKMADAITNAIMYNLWKRFRNEDVI
ncbi:MAG TPA: spore protease YyaC [Clostridiales bacterium]|nr:spore protease YyaC [Clostridiales bacterium]